MVRRHLIDWRFIAMLCVMLCVMVLCWGFVARQQQVDSLITISRESTEQVRVLSAKVDAQNVAAKAAARASVAQRKALRVQNAKLQAQLAAIVKYLRDQGIAIPTTALAPRTSGVGSTRPKVPRPRPSHPAPGSPGPTAPSPANPGRDLLCQVVPPLCNGLPLGLPTLLP